MSADVDMRGGHLPWRRCVVMIRDAKGATVIVQKIEVARSWYRAHDLFSLSILQMRRTRWRTRTELGHVRARFSGERTMRPGSVAT
ncbi:MAG: hypothetical protein BGN91_15620 [Nitrobacter sp. 62-13]|nr:MAG: hypothetical protein BGN91_15620 [Nitrobacter sp. 62-13]